MSDYKAKVTYTRHNKSGSRTQPVYHYATLAERDAMDAMRHRFGPVPLSRSLLIRTALATLQRILDTGFVPPVEDRLMMVERDDADLPLKLALSIDFARLAGHADAA